jgi:hypothetical protein
LIPLNDHDSGIPAAFLEITVTNTTACALDYTLAATLANSLPANAINRYLRSGDLHLLHLDTDGLIEEGMTAVEAIRERYDGQKRNPWNEFECGSNYARSMASYWLLNAFSGFRFDLAHDRIGFAPLQTQEGRFTCFWSLDPGWGQFVLQPGEAKVRLLYGEFRLCVLDLPAFAEHAVQRVTLKGEVIPFTQSGGEIRFDEPVRVQRDQTLCVLA